jgi:hypothetical protein
MTMVMPAAPGATAGAMPAMALVPGAAMLLAHAMAAVVMGLLLADGERAVFSVLGLLAQIARPAARIFRPVLAVLAVAVLDSIPAWPGIASRCPDVRRLPQQVMARQVTRRGPPVPVRPATI